MFYGATIFLSSFLLFMVQPLIARLILPWFGGSAAVWTTCMLFFQMLLLAGYAYAHLLGTRLAPRRQAIVHVALLAVAAATLPIAPSDSWKPDAGTEPVTRILLLLAVAVGLPYFMLASTSPLLQAWFARARPGENPYRLFALSNLASLIALIGYPLAAEPMLANGAQVSIWSWLFAAFALLCAALAWRAARSPAAAIAAAPGAHAQAPQDAMRAAVPPGPRDRLRWLVFAAAPSVLLLAVTNHITQNVASIPLLWLAPLTLYLLSFILTFEGRSLYRPEWFWILVLVLLGAMAWLLIDEDFQFRLEVQLGVFLSGLFVACMFCHGELYRLRPPTRSLTAFYLTVAAGGALGGLLVAVVAPLVFDAYHELGLSLVAIALLAAARFRSQGRVVAGTSLAVLMGVAGCATYDGLRFQNDVRMSDRNFYGVLRIKELGRPGEAGHVRRLLHGVILHGEQFPGAGTRRELTTYYQRTSGIGGAIAAKQEERRAIRVGVIGLGVGTLAAYGRAGDEFRFYEINARVAQIAASEFTYLADSAAAAQVVLGDARLRLEGEAPQRFDVLAVDAFSSDSIPVHLITREALAVYLRHLQPHGIIAFHVSNRFLDLVPVVARLAGEAGAHAVVVYEADKDAGARTQSDWVLVSRDPLALAHAELEKRSAVPAEDRADWRTWSDDFSNLVQILK